MIARRFDLSFRKGLWALGAAFIIVVPVCVQAGGEDWGVLRRWIGRLPFDKERALWHEPVLQAPVEIMAKHIGNKLFINMLQDGVAIPVEEKDNVLYGTLCRAHVCDQVFMNWFINLSRRTLEVCWHGTEGREDLWITGAGESKELERDSCRTGDVYSLYKARHGSEKIQQGE